MLRWQHSVSHLFSVRSPVITAGDDSLHLFCILLLFGLHLGDLSLKFQLCSGLSPLRVAAASHVSWQSNTTQHDIVGPVVLITWEPSPLPQETLSGFNAALDLVWLSDYNVCEAEWYIEFEVPALFNISAHGMPLVRSEHLVTKDGCINYLICTFPLSLLSPCWSKKQSLSTTLWGNFTHWTNCIKYTEVVH